MAVQLVPLALGLVWAQVLELVWVQVQVQAQVLELVSAQVPELVWVQAQARVSVQELEHCHQTWATEADYRTVTPKIPDPDTRTSQFDRSHGR